MLRNLIRKILICLSNRETQFILFILSVILLNYPFIKVVSYTFIILKLPFINLYLLIAWIVYIITVFIIVKAINKSDSNGVNI